ncbi:hypothetical protein [Metabacillus fastidiosus]|uniref:hypothetical protein n=1 Tax=Metabacillus fastidiosus TaxID=1458 RepID=UPI000825B9B7|nr:hypothetical protein [Metabacillus fastidiosus]MED4461260.1 hypothetical protein [Metabacillus fastidiosus]
MKRVIGIIFSLFIITACGNNNLQSSQESLKEKEIQIKEKQREIEDFKDSLFGMTRDEIIEFERKQGNVLFTEEEDTLLKGITLKFKDVEINGKKAEIEYTFCKERSKHSILNYDTYDEKISNHQKEKKKKNLNKEENEKLWQKFKKENTELFEEISNIPDPIQFNDFILVSVMYVFNDLEAEENEELAENYKALYGEPEDIDLNKRVKDYFWFTSRMDIYYSPIAVQYSGTYHALEKFIINNEQ